MSSGDLLIVATTPSGRRGSARRRRTAVTAVLALLFQMAVNVVVVGTAAPAEAADPIAPATGRLVTVAPHFIAETISIPAGGIVTLTATGAGRPVPAGAAGVAMTINARSDSAGALVAFPAAAVEPAVTTLSLAAGKWARGASIVGVDDAGRLSVRNRSTAAAAVTVQVSAYITADAEPRGATFTALSPTAAFFGVVVEAGGTADVRPAGTGLPTTGVAAYALTVGVRGAATGQVTVYPTGGSRPIPQVELTGLADVTAASHALVGAGTGGSVTVANASTAAVTVWGDVTGYYAEPRPSSPGASVVPLTPASVGRYTIAAGAKLNVPFSGVGGVPGAGAVGACLSITADPGSFNSWIIAHPAGSARPDGYSAPYYVGRSATTFSYAKFGTNGAVSLSNIGIGAITVSVEVSCYLRSPRPPLAPSDVSAVPGDRSASVFWREPPTDAPLSRYVVTANPGGRSVSVPGTETSAEIDGLVNGTTYVISVVAESAGGQSPAADAAALTPGPPPSLGAPFVTFVYPRDQAARVSWAAPNDGAASVTSYRLTASPGGESVTVPGSVTEAVIGGLVNGTAHTFTVTAINANGPGEPSPPSEPATPRPADVPLKPAGLLTVALDRSVDVQWVAPADGGAPITGYTVTAEPGAHRVEVAADTTVARLSGLTNGTTYTIGVTATNSAGTGQAAEATEVRPSAARVPGAPSDLRASAVGQGTASVRWNAPVDTGTGPVTSYRVTADPGGATTTVATTSAQLSGLDPSVAYQFTVVAVNEAGNGVPARTPAPVKPAVQVKNNPRTLSAAELSTLVSIDGDSTLIFIDPSAAILALRSGTILLVPPSELAPRGMLRTVTTVAKNGGELRVSTRQTPLTDVFDEADLVSTAEIGDSDVEQIISESPAIRRKQPTIKGKTLAQGARAAGAGVDIGIRDGHLIAEVALSINAEQADDPLNNADKVPPVGGRLEANLDFAPHLENTLEITRSDGIRSHHLNRVSFKAELRAKVGAMKAAERELPGFKLKGRCFTIQAGPVPVVICLELEVKPKISVNGSVGITTAVSFGRLVGGELSTANGVVTESHGINDAYTPARHDVDAYADGNLEVSLPVESTVYFYNAAGPGITVRPYLQFKFDTTQDPWWELRLGITLGVFLKSREFFGKQIDFSRDDVANFFYTMAKADGPFQGLKITPDEADVDPGESVRFTTAVVGYPGDLPVSWRLISGPGTVRSDGTFESPLSGTAVVEAVSPATDLRKELRQRAVVNINGSTRPDVPRNPRAVAKPLAAQVTWDVPVTDGRSPIVKYVVVPVPNGRVTIVPGSQTTAKVTGLSPNVPLRFQVYAVNAVGASAASVATNPVSPVEGVRPTGAVFNVAVDADGVPDKTDSAGDYGATVSGDGRYVFFDVAGRSNLAPAEVQNNSGAYGQVLMRKDLVTGELTLASRRPDGRTPASLEGSAMATSYDGNRVAYVARYWDAPEGTWRYPALILDLTTGVTSPLGDGSLDIGSIKLVRGDTAAVVHGRLPDGAASGTGIYVISGAGSPVPVPCPTAHCDPSGIPWDVDGAGESIVYTSRAAYNTSMLLYRYTVSTGQTVRLSPPTDSWGYTDSLHAVISADGAYIAADLAYDGSGEDDEYQGIARPRNNGQPMTNADIVRPYPENQEQTEAWGISEDGRAILYVDSGFSNPNVSLFDTLTGEDLLITTGWLSDVELADNPTLVVWRDGNPGVWARRLA
ncbi:fibronectin type III domain-containing protein [Asanoa sp. NPDC049518]|uniref:fibronectin type III domain-containing protein n=1 Tax=unclassified Asanoa TaxID=2685164 RepID=UPI0034433961